MITNPSVNGRFGTWLGESIWPRGNLTAVILGGGETDSRRLFPLTQFRTLPAIPFGGSYRIIDLLMSNLINSGVNKIHILTAYNSYSLNRHLQRTYDMSGGVQYGGDGYIEVVANSMSPDSQQWVTGTAGIVRHFMSYFDSNMKNRFIQDIMVLPGDHVYSTDLTPIISYHHSTGADLTIVCRPVSGEQASRLGVVKLDSDNRIRTFREKPDPDQLSELAMSDDEMRPFLSATVQQQMHQLHSRRHSRRDAGLGFGGHSPGPGSSLDSGSAAASFDEGDGVGAARALWAARGHARVGGGAGGRVVLDTMTSGDDVELSQRAPGFVGSTGIYIFRRGVLSKALERHYKAQDFGRQIIPELIREGLRVQAYRLPGYWADVGGSVGDFYQANLALLEDPPSIDLNRPTEAPLFKFPLTIPASQLRGTRISRCIVSAGCILHEANLRNSVIGPRSIVGSRVTVTDSVIMGADHYEHEKPQQRPLSPTYPPMGIGEGSVVQRAIVDLNCRVGRNVALVNKEGVYESFDRAVQGMYVRDGITVITREAVIPDGTVL
ncbi:hypothetical protein VOLCADRAFT_89889 [Volvox carteri f. nagariensis]|uniref:glucose-1-phosphate adenylyltransferase n=1 Tax=Volvox carteri f. nagariensis TaxID=3068 RepID=D8TSX6_VOLCA|nr:uncharacterized protein VOLCADRAFT_89889 [Volvox carteri f. nagariensis]EFJ49454.1 hypothetical protein VOLCADRAFT_89889 [Volvox carteri f. nagariensis]|eukprot:XP_002949435.1 hypothetical protein VOLCADRAFT_89889 [Volvox carteri f. nagariensis]